MKPRFILAAVCGLALSLSAFGPRPGKGKSAKAQVMILGSYHMSNPGLDVINMKADDVRTPKRQQEMEELVRKLARFRPTKVCLEVPAGGKADSLVQVRYQKYRKGEYELKANETEQIGFRLAKQLGHPRVYCIDATGRFEFGELMQYAQRTGKGPELQRRLQQTDSMMKAENQVLLRTPLPEYFRRINQPALHEQYHDWYLSILPYGTPKEQAGGRLVADYYARNVSIIANLMRAVNAPDDRALVVYGNGHSSFFKSILFGSSQLQVVEAYDYLK